MLSNKASLYETSQFRQISAVKLNRITTIVQICDWLQLFRHKDNRHNENLFSYLFSYVTKT